MLNAYFDDSGTDGSGAFCVVAGYLARVDQWLSFSDAWDKELRSAPSIPHLKTSQAESRRGPFWGWDKEAVEAKLLRLVEIINAHALGGVASLVGHKPYAEQARGYLPATIDNPYWMCFQRVVIETLHFAHDLDGGKVNIVFDTQGEGMERRAALIFDAWRDIFESTPYGDLLGSITFAKDEDVLPLQAADLLAWHVRRHGERAIKKAPENRAVTDKIGRLPVRLFGWTPQEVSDFVDRYQQFHPDSPINRPDAN